MGRFNAGRAQPTPIEYGAGGHYQYASRTGTLAAALAANAVLFSMRNGGAKPMILLALRAWLQPLTVFTAHQEISLEAFVARGFTASHSGGNAANLTGNNLKARTSMPSTGLADLRLASTAALGGGTLTPDDKPFAVALGSPLIVNGVAGTAFSPYNKPELEYAPDIESGEHPIICAQDEGIVIRNGIVWPAAGTAVLAVAAKWAEVDAFPELS